MTATATPIPETLSSPPPMPPGRCVVVAAAALTAFAAMTLTPWLLTTNSKAENDPTTHTSVAAPQRALPPDQVSVDWNAGSFSGPAAYVQFCRNSLTLCVPTAAALPGGYAEFCWNSPSLCTVAKPN
jgi:hypothetical protein